ncbi:MAG TPA: SpoIID/LytB domain-containing protein [Gemmatimonadaceae bacterium]|nr:SpoIID/LytB domain-containing protein [Gemmatimonadaceae bacterium]
MPRSAEVRRADGRRRRDDGGRIVRISLGVAASGVGRLGGSGEWRLYGADGRAVLARGEGSDAWTVERQGARLRVLRPDGGATAFRDGPLVARPIGAGAMVTWNGRRYRGELALFADSTRNGVLAVNRLAVEDYLRGVVPLEIGPRVAGEHAAIEAQAVAARSYTYVRIGGIGPGAMPGARPYDMVSTVDDQVYGGADAEKPLTDAAVVATAGQVIAFAGRVVNAPYHSTCGGSTAEVDEVWWRQPPEPYLRRVSDRIPGSDDRYYCDPSPRFRWTRSYDASTLATVLDRYLRQYAAIPAGGEIGAVRFVAATGTTPSGRAAGVRIETDRGSYVVRGNDARFVFRSSGGEILNSTYFTLQPTVGRDGRLSQLTISGSGYGHGIGMCQWGAIGRARAGQDYRTILQTYYPGTTLAQAD